MASQIASLIIVQQRSLLEGPALKPPPGVIPNFVDPPNQTSLGYGILFMCAGLSTLAVVIRLYSKAFCTKKLDIEDGKSRFNKLISFLELKLLGLAIAALVRLFNRMAS